MDAFTSAAIFLFEDFRLDRRRGGLFRRDDHGLFVPVTLGSRALDVLAVLVARAGDLVPKQEIMDAAWPGSAVEESNLTVQLSALRRILDAERAVGSCIQTVPGRGYRFVLRVTRPEETSSSTSMPAVGLPAQSEGAARVRSWRTLWRWLAVGVCGIAAAALLTWAWQGRWFAGPTTAPRLSIAVLPFENLSGGQDQDYLVEGITDDLTTDLSHMPGAFVIARNSANSYRGKATNPRQIGNELGVRYVLEGSVRKLGAIWRVNAQLVSTETGAYLWTDRFEEPLDDLNAGQEEIVRRIGTTLGIKVVEIESARSARERPTNPDAFDLVLRARSLRNDSRSRHRDEQAQALYEQALKLDPYSGAAMLGIASILIDRNLGPLGQWSILDDVARAGQLISAAEAIQPNSENVLVAVAELAQAQERWTDLAFAAQRIIDLYPNRVEGYELLGMAKRFVGTVEEAVQLYELSIKLNPLESNLFYRCSCMGYALLLVGRYDESIIWFERSLAANPEASKASRGARYRSIAAAHALSGRLDAARSALREANILSPYATARIFFPDNPNNPAEVAQIRRIIDGLRLAGLPDHAEEDADFGVMSDDMLRRDLAGPTPTTMSGARTIRTGDLVPFLAEQKQIVVDTGLYSWGRSIPGAVGLKNAGLGGSYSDTAQDHLRRKMRELSKDDLTIPIIAVGWNSERFDGYNLALRLVALGYTNVYWYRGGREAWEIASLPETELVVQDW